MAILVLDLDLTCFCIEKDRPKLYGEHTLSNHGFKFKTKSSIYPVEVINPKELADLLNHISEDPLNDIMFLTTGLWNRQDVIDLLCLVLNDYGLKPITAQRLQLAMFHTPDTDFEYYFKDEKTTQKIDLIRDMTKGDRLDEIIKQRQLAHKQFVLVDDMKKQIRSCWEKDYVYPVRATTRKDSNGEKVFYEEAQSSMDFARAKEKEIFAKKLERFTQFRFKFADSEPIEQTKRQKVQGAACQIGHNEAKKSEGCLAA